MRNILLSIFIILSLFCVAQNNCLDIDNSTSNADYDSQNSYSGSASISVSNGSGIIRTNGYKVITVQYFKHKTLQQQIICYQGTT